MNGSGAERFGMNVSGYSIRQTLQGSFDALVIDNAVLRLTIVPELGGKIASLIRLESGHEYLLQPLSRSGRTARVPTVTILKITRRAALMSVHRLLRNAYTPKSHSSLAGCLIMEMFGACHRP